MTLEIITPDQIFFSGEVSSVTLPGTSGMFTIWKNHAPMISMLSNGKLTYVTDGKEKDVRIQGGFMKIDKNVISVCVESL